MRTLFLLGRLRVLDVARSRTSAGFFLLLPVVLVLLVGLVFANGRPFQRERVALVDVDPGGSSGAIASALDDLTEVRVDREPSLASATGKLRSGMANAVVVTGPRGSVRVLVGPRDAIFGRGLAASLPVTATVETIEVPRWGYVQWLFPGMLTHAVMLSGLFGLGTSMLKLRQSGFLKKLATTRLPRSVFVAAQIGARALLVFVQVVLLVAAATFAFDLALTPSSAAWTLALSLLGLLCFMGVGFALACAIRTDAMMIDVIFAASIPIIFLSELFFPLDELPAPLPAIGAALPSTQMVRAIRGAVLFGADGAGAMLPALAVMGAWAIAGYGVAVLAFRWRG